MMSQEDKKTSNLELNFISRAVSSTTEYVQEEDDQHAFAFDEHGLPERISMTPSHQHQR